MAKPIFLIGIPFSLVGHVSKVQDFTNKKFVDYYTLVYAHGNQGIEFKCFYEKDFNEVKYEELKQIVKDSINDL